MKFALYMHSGSGNHGCEALARTISSLIPNNCEKTLFSKRPNEEEKYVNNHTFLLTQAGVIPKKSTISGFVTALRMKFLKQKLAYIAVAYKSLFKYCDKDTVAISIGGDNYCYDGMPEVLADLNVRLNKKGTKTVLLGCSVEPELLKDEKVIKDMNMYSLITARESITFDAMKQAGITADVRLIPDSAFLLPTTETELPEGFAVGNTVGINVSPLVKGLEKEDGVLINSYYNLIDYILNQTDMTVALIPHVVWSVNDDLAILKEFYEKYKQSGRVVLVEDHNAQELKYIISKCRFLVAARTHASIAAYSTCVPTLVVGYSVKSRGIAKDLFGSEENYVLSLDKIKNGDELVASAKWLFSNEKTVKAHLEKTVPEYIKPIKDITDLLKAL